MVKVEDFFSVEDNVHCVVHDISDLEDKYPQWDSLSKKEKLRLSYNVSPIFEESFHNTTTVGLNEYLVDNLDLNQSVNDDASHLAFGDDNTTPQTENTDLNNEVGRLSVTTTTDDGATLETSTFVDTSELNGNTLKEVGLVNQSSSSGDILFNHVTISDIVKTDTKTITTEVSLTFSSV